MFGNWYNFLRIAENITNEEIDTFDHLYVGDNIIELEYIPPKILKDNKLWIILKYIEAKRILGKQPTNTEFSRNTNIATTRVREIFGSWNEFIIYMGDNPINVPRLDRQHQKRNPTKKVLIQEYLKIRNRMGRKLSAHEITKYGKYTENVYIHKWGTWNNFLKEIGESTKLFRSGGPRKYSDDSIIKKYEIVKRKIKDIPKSKDLDNIYPNLYEHLVRRFGGLEKIRIMRNEKSNSDLMKETIMKIKQDNKSRIGAKIVAQRVKSLQHFLSNHGGIEAFQNIYKMLNSNSSRDDIAKELKLSTAQVSRLVDNLFETKYIARNEVRKYIELYIDNIQKEQTATSEWVKNI
ncbi:MAG: hypothetical protein NTX44_05475 [Ignavibacteriales bacterium]|nr:hypothetical protein [Ignavibacteriales bacterium]